MRRSVIAATLMAYAIAGFAGPADEAMEVVQRWAKAFTDSDVDGIVKLYSPDAIFIGTGSKSLLTRPEEVRRYFEQALLTNRPRGAELTSHSVQVLSDDVVVVSGLDLVSGVRNGASFSAPGRVNFVLRKRDGAWSIVSFHRSALPS